MNQMYSQKIQSFKHNLNSNIIRKEIRKDQSTYPFCNFPFLYCSQTTSHIVTMGLEQPPNYTTPGTCNLFQAHSRYSRYYSRYSWHLCLTCLHPLWSSLKLHSRYSRYYSRYSRYSCPTCLHQLHSSLNLYSRYFT